MVSLKRIAALGTILLLTSTHAAVTNGDFETGNLTGWATIGATHADTAAIGTPPSQGTYHAYIDNTGNFTASAGAVATFLGVSGPSILGLGQGTPTVGSAISQDITVNAGDILSFDWNFLTDEHNEGIEYNDFAIFTIDSTPFLLASRDSTFFTLNLASPPPGFDGQTNYASDSYNFGSAGTYKVGFAVFNVGDTGHNSVLLVDAVSVTVPEPAMLGLGALMFSLYRRRGVRRWAEIKGNQSGRKKSRGVGDNAIDLAHNSARRRAL